MAYNLGWLSNSPIPAWIGPVNQWTGINSSSLTGSGVGWSGTAPGGTGNYAEVIDSWGDMIVNTKGLYIGANFVSGVFLVVHGGGHGNYAGDEVYAFGPLDGNSPSWSRLRDPAIPAPSGVGEDGSGNPVSTHTYQSMVYIGNGANNGMLRIGGAATYPSAGSTLLSHYYDFTVASPNTNQPWSKKADALGPADVCALDPVNNNIWSHSHNLGGNGNNVQFYSVGSNTYDSVGFKSPSFGSLTASSAIDYTRNVWAIYGDSGLNFLTTQASFSGFSADYTTPTVSGTAPNSGGRKGILYDPVDDQFVVWDDGGKKLWFLKNTAGSWAWTNTTPASGAIPGAAAASGIFGKFRYAVIGGARGYLLLPSSGSNVFFYRAG
jgi:hypothetical protein